MSDTHFTVIKPKVGWQLIDWKELYEYRDLFFFLVWRDVKIQYKQTVLGFFWAIIQPVMNMLVMTVVFGKLAEISSDGVPYAIFNLVALVPWLYFQNSLTQASQSLVTNSNMITKVYFPRLIIPTAPVLAKLIDFGIGLVIIAGVLAYYQIMPTTTIFLLPVLILLLIMTTAGAGMWLTALSVQYRDVKYVLTFLIELLKFAAPVVWGTHELIKKAGPVWKHLYGLYPVGGIIDGFRSVFLGKPVDWTMLGLSAFMSVVIFVSGIFYFRRTEKNFADVA